MTRPTDHSLPGMGWALITTTSSSRSLKNRFSPAARRDSADIGSPWDPVEITQTWPGGEAVDVLDVDQGVVGDVQEAELAGQGHVLLHRPAEGGHRSAAGDGGVGHLLDPVDVAGEAGHDEPAVRARQEDLRAASRPPSISDGVKPGSSALVESASSRRIPGSEASAPMRARSVRRPSTGWRSILKSPEWRMMPCGVWKAVAKAWGTEWVTGMNSTSQGPIRRRSPSRTGMNWARLGHPGLVDPVAGQGQGELGAVDGDGEVAEQVGQAAGVVLVPVGEDDAVDPVGVLPQVGEVRAGPGRRRACPGRGT